MCARRYRTVYWDVNVVGLSPPRFAPRKLFRNEPSNARHKLLSGRLAICFLSLTLHRPSMARRTCSATVHHPAPATLSQPLAALISLLLMFSVIHLLGRVARVKGTCISNNVVLHTFVHRFLKTHLRTIKLTLSPFG